MSLITNLRGREILDSRGQPTVEAEVTLANGACALAAVPSGASTGSREAVEKRDNATRYNGKGVQTAVANINDVIAPALRGKDARAQQEIDNLLIALDGSDNKARLGANAVLAVSLATLKAAAAGAPLYQAVQAAVGESDGGIVLPTPLMNVLNGGAHASNNLDIQEFMLVPHGFNDFPSALAAGVECFHALRRLLGKKGMVTAVGDEGGFAPNVNGSEEALELLATAISTAGYRGGEQISIALDCAASEFYEKGVYRLPADDFSGDSSAFINLLCQWADAYPIVSIEDGCDEGDWDGWRELTERLGRRLQLVGDDLFVTNPTILRQGIDAGVANALLVKPNQIGTVSETLDAVRVAKRAGYNTVMSHRSGETEYSDIADLAVGGGCRQIKTGAPCRGERTAKYNQLLRIADSTDCGYGGDSFAGDGRTV